MTNGAQRSIRIEIAIAGEFCTCLASPISTVTALSIRLARSHEIPLGYEAEEFRRDGQVLPIYA